VIGARAVMEETVRRLRLPLRITPINDLQNLAPRANQIMIFEPLEKPLGRFEIGLAAPETGSASVAFIKKGVDFARAGQIAGIVTAPINKEAMNMAGFHYPGHTELLADLTHSAEVGMMIVGGPLKIMFTTTHVAIKDLSSLLTTDRIAKAIRIAHRGLKDYFGIAAPKIGVAALNPHAGEHGLFGDEEDARILPAVRRARAAGIDASDPMPADTLFGKAAHGAYDGIVAMYHDQGLIPLKLVAFGTCVNVTVGLPIIRTSVDHGTAYDIAGKGVADPGSLVEAVKLAANLASNRHAAWRGPRREES
ncbi:MAG TPA: 4-hydroxythreonine-4-phosphate dehydrogenase PdxA, partial [Nitrospiraceae bacterium]|nr:4-hydroxythreonine-4-phosphate dehydrogenase PdxA [Nitrospiraceae bacterium]